ncbi:hypothetical protein M378DRAFT_157530 [Amanita muscaria Koide BX008]|uniref:Uncharacterized protein n=1 Tax=Amanita muscaria (strain Koide BX008) TaxID=946122 RepID=A0A0C2XJL6_AMAMK|nr:hypothetical protein M378DRAFT_157530 [Amanita muscaria Koide BX008]
MMKACFPTALSDFRLILHSTENETITTGVALSRMSLNSSRASQEYVCNFGVELS